MVCFCEANEPPLQETYEITPKSLATIALPQCRVNKQGDPIGVKAVGELEIHVVGILTRQNVYIPMGVIQRPLKIQWSFSEKNKNMILVGIYLIHQQF